MKFIFKKIYNINRLCPQGPDHPMSTLTSLLYLQRAKIGFCQPTFLFRHFIIWPFGNV